MVLPNDKVKVFISSACGKGKDEYNIARAGLRALIESTQLAQVYLFEDTQASVLTAGQHYTFALEGCDLCIFLIDNKDGVPNGVQIEIDRVRSCNIKALYYFCDKNSKEETPLQKSLIGAQNAKSRVIHSFEEFIKNGCQGLIDDLITVYKSYCKGRLIDSNEIQVSAKESQIINADVQRALPTSNDVIINIDRCKKHFANFILEQKIEIEKTDDFDEYCNKFLSILFEQKSISDFNMALFMKTLEDKQDSEYHQVISKRWDAIQSYFLGDLEKCVSMLKEALHMAKSYKLPEWIIMDILIDLRNQSFLLDKSKNQYTIENDAQKELSENPQMVYYPLIDRFSENLYQKYIEDFLKSKIESPYTVTISNNLMHLIDSITSLYIVSMFNGSLTHLLLIYDQIEHLSFCLCEKYDNWSLRVLLLKMSVIRGKSKETEGLSNVFTDVLAKMNAKDALDIYQFSNNLPIPFERQMSNLDAFKITGYFLSDEDFDRISTAIVHDIDVWLNAGNRCFEVGSHIFDALDGVAYRISPNILASICCKFIEHNLNRWCTDIFKLIANKIDINLLSPDIAKELINNIIALVNNKGTETHTYGIGQAIISMRKTNKEITNELDHAVKINMPDFYDGIYRLETTQNESKDMPQFLQKYIDKINSRNETQGVGGRFSEYADKPHIIIRSILMQSEVTFSDNLIDAAFKASCNTLLLERQTLKEKSEAIELLIFLCKRYPSSIERNSVLVKKLLEHKKIIESGKSALSNFSETILRFSALFLYDCFHEDIYLSLMSNLPYLYNNKFFQIQASQTILSVLEDDEQVKIEPRLEIVILQCTLNWCNSEEINVRFCAVKILFQLLRTPKNSDIICNQLIKSMEEDNIYIKNVILRNLEKLKPINTATYQYLLQKASVDSNYVVRKVYNEVASKSSGIL